MLDRTRAHTKEGREDRRKATVVSALLSLPFTDRQADTIAHLSHSPITTNNNNHRSTTYLGVGPEEGQLRQDLRHQLLVAQHLFERRTMKRIRIGGM